MWGETQVRFSQHSIFGTPLEEGAWTAEGTMGRTATSRLFCQFSVGNSINITHKHSRKSSWYEKSVHYPVLVMNQRALWIWNLLTVTSKARYENKKIYITLGFYLLPSPHYNRILVINNGNSCTHTHGHSCMLGSSMSHPWNIANYKSWRIFKECFNFKQTSFSKCSS